MWIRPAGDSADIKNAKNHEFIRVGAISACQSPLGHFGKFPKSPNINSSGSALAATRFRVRALPGAQHTIKSADLRSGVLELISGGGFTLSHTLPLNPLQAEARNST